jgi:hypothetical protein
MPTAFPMYLHIGAPKTGTTYLQTVMRKNRRVLTEAGYCYPGATGRHLFPAQDLLGRGHSGANARQIVGSWDAHVAEVLAWNGPAIMSHEILGAGVRDAEVKRVVDDFSDRELHIVYTARDLLRQLPAVWQESIKNRSTLTLGEYFDLIRIKGPVKSKAHVAERRIWRAQNAEWVLGKWADVVPADRIHVVTVPPKGAPSTLLWERFARTVGLVPGDYDLDAGGSNISLDAVEASVLRRLNVLLRDGDTSLPWSRYHYVKHYLATDVLPQRSDRRPIELSLEQQTWAVRQSGRVADAIAAGGYDVVGDLDELRPSPGRERSFDPDVVPVEAERDVALAAVEGLLRRKLADDKASRADDDGSGESFDDD